MITGAIILAGLAGVFVWYSSRAKSVQGGSVGGVVDQVVNAVTDAVESVTKPRGIRNNNPLNIKWSSVQTWQGQVGQDEGGFLIFDMPENGIRAAARILQSYRNAGYITVRQIIERWTSGDSPALQESYISHASGVLGIAPDEEVPRPRWFDLIKVMIKHENGQQPYPDTVILAGISAA